MNKPETCPCGICGRPTIMTGTKRCDKCWELERRIEADPKLARRILENLLPESFASKRRRVEAERKALQK